MRAARLGSPENLTAQVIEEFYCTRCRNDGCSNAGFGDSPWLKRILTQVDRFFHSPQANPEDAKYRELIGKDFQDMTQHAMRLMISAQRSDWEVPEMAAILDSRGLPQPPRFDPNPEVEAQVQQMLAEVGPSDPVVEADPLEDPGLYPDDVEEVPPSKVPDFARGLVGADGAPRERVPAKVPSGRPPANVPKRSGLMLDGGPPPPPAPDPWAVPEHHNPAATKVQVGGTFQFGATPPGKKK